MIKFVVIIRGLTAYKSVNRFSMLGGDTVTQKTTTRPDFGTKQERCVDLGKYIIDNNATVREAAKVFGISKSTVHMGVCYYQGLCLR